MVQKMWTREVTPWVYPKGGGIYPKQCKETFFGFKNITDNISNRIVIKTAYKLLRAWRLKQLIYGNCKYFNIIMKRGSFCIGLDSLLVQMMEGRLVFSWHSLIVTVNFHFWANRQSFLHQSDIMMIKEHNIGHEKGRVDKFFFHSIKYGVWISSFQNIM